MDHAAEGIISKGKGTRVHLAIHGPFCWSCARVTDAERARLEIW